MKHSLILIILFLLASCSSTRSDETLQESFKIHESAIEMGQKTEEKLLYLKNNADSLDASYLVLIDSIGSIEEDLEAWESTIVEVPGFEHEHHNHDHDHDHDHGSSPDLTPEMVLEIQKDLMTRIERLNARVEELGNTLAQ